jgi:alpha-glucuronidase
MLNYTKTNLNKLIEVLNESGYIVRFEKGNFKSGYAIVKNRKIIIVNKFFDMESRINTLLEIMDLIDIDSRILTPKSKSFHRFLVKSKLLLGIDLIKNEEE